MKAQNQMNLVNDTTKIETQDSKVNSNIFHSVAQGIIKTDLDSKTSSNYLRNQFDSGDESMEDPEIKKETINELDPVNSHLEPEVTIKTEPDSEMSNTGIIFRPIPMFYSFIRYNL